jgi:hypothetical protein
VLNLVKATAPCAPRVAPATLAGVSHMLTDVTCLARCGHLHCNSRASLRASTRNVNEGPKTWSPARL